jgi:predicted metal-dependent HD superfamily phosphohydrolase
VEPLVSAWTAALGDHAAAAGEDLVRRYAEPHRQYHDRRHLSQVLEALAALRPGGEVPPTVVCAAYGHDAVYDPTAPDNEQRSADLVASVLHGLGQPPTFVDEVVRLVLLTATHLPADDDADGALLSDADLAVLAAPDERYRAYAAAVRREYAHLSDEAFRAGRSAVLRELGERPRLYATPGGVQRWDAAARRNLRRELSRLAAAAADPQP